MWPPAGVGPSPDADLLPPQWFPEVTHFCRGTPMVLIGCKTDLRKDKEQLRKLRAAQLEPITYSQVGRARPPPSAHLHMKVPRSPFGLYSRGSLCSHQECKNTNLKMDSPWMGAPGNYC